MFLEYVTWVHGTPCEAGARHANPWESRTREDFSGAHPPAKAFIVAEPCPRMNFKLVNLRMFCSVAGRLQVPYSIVWFEDCSRPGLREHCKVLLLAAKHKQQDSSAPSARRISSACISRLRSRFASLRFKRNGKHSGTFGALPIFMRGQLVFCISKTLTAERLQQIAKVQLRFCLGDSHNCFFAAVVRATRCVIEPLEPNLPTVFSQSKERCVLRLRRGLLHWCCFLLADQAPCLRDPRCFASSGWSGRSSRHFLCLGQVQIHRCKCGQLAGLARDVVPAGWSD